jgi:hypothetical protein
MDVCLLEVPNVDAGGLPDGLPDGPPVISTVGEEYSQRR